MTYARQAQLFRVQPEGFGYEEDFVSTEEERELAGRISELPLKEFEFHGYTGKRRVIFFGWRYDFDRYALHETEPIPEFLHAVRARAAAFAGLAAEDLEHVLLTEYGPGTTIGWHRDKAVFEDVVGISLLSPCIFRMRLKAGSKWERCNVSLTPRSAYLLRGEARTLWEHSIPAVPALRYSITFRSMKAAG
jgi:alkylated DNA repair dioxygenase AlkB